MDLSPAVVASAPSAQRGAVDSPPQVAVLGSSTPRLIGCTIVRGQKGTFLIIGGGGHIGPWGCVGNPVANSAQVGPHIRQHRRLTVLHLSSATPGFQYDTFHTITTIGAYTRGFIFIPLGPKRDSKAPWGSVHHRSASRLQGNRQDHTRVWPTPRLKHGRGIPHLALSVAHI